MYFEKRRQPLWLLALSVLMTVSFGIAVSAATSSLAGSVVALVSTSVVAIAWWRLGAPITVTEEDLVVGAMHLPLSFVGEVQALEPQDFAVRIGAQARGDDAYSLLARDGGGIVVMNTDASDPFKQWVIGSKTPFALEAAIVEAKKSASL